MTALTTRLSDPLIHALGWALIHSLWIGVVIALLLALALRAVPGASGSPRYLLACAALGGFVVLTGIAGYRHYRAEPLWVTAHIEPTASMALPMPAASGVDTGQSAHVSRAITTPSQSLLEWVEASVVPWLAPLWLTGLLTASIRLLVGWVRLRRLRHIGTKPLCPSTEDRVASIRSVMKVKRCVRVVESTRAAVPMVVGWLRPVVLLPASCITGLTPRQLEAVITHELAHVRRHDCLVNLIQCVCETLLFYHPAAWWIGGVIRKERERCCDELVVSITGDPVGYARALLNLAEAAPPHRRLSLASQGGDLSGRVRRLLGREPQQRHTRWSTGLWSALACLCVAGIFVVGTLAQETPANDPAALVDAILSGETIQRDPVELPPTTIIDIPYNQLISGDPTQNVVIQPNDVVKVITAGHFGYVYLQGETQRPGAYGLPGYNHLTLKQLIVTGGGYPKDGTPVYAKLIRRTDDNNEQTLYFNIDDVFDGWAQDTFLAPNDLVLISHEPGPENEEAKARRLLRERIVELNKAIPDLHANRDESIKEFGGGHRVVESLVERIKAHEDELAEARKKLTPGPGIKTLPILLTPEPDPAGRAPLPDDLVPHALPNNAVARDRVIVTAYHSVDGGEKTTFDRLLDDEGNLHLPGVSAVPFVGKPIEDVQAEVLKLMKEQASYRHTERVTVTLPNRWLFTPMVSPLSSGGGPVAMYPITQADFRLNDALAVMRRSGELPEDIKVIRIIRQEPIGAKKDAESNSP